MVLIEKKQQILDEIEAIKAQREIEIEAKVAVYRSQLEEQPIAGLEKYDAVLAAIDTLIAYDEGTIAEPVCVAEETVAARPGMQNIFTPRR